MKNSTLKDSGRGLWAWDIVKVVTILPIIAFAGIFYFQGFNEESNRIIIRLTAKIASILFCLAFVASAFHRWQKNSFSWWLMMNRKYFGISFAIMHLLHLAALLLLQQKFHPVFDLAASTSLLAGGMAYLFAILMLLTSFPFFEKMISKKNWKILHTVGGYWIWVIFINTNLKGMMKGELEYVLVVLLFVFVMVLRIWRRK